MRWKNSLHYGSTARSWCNTWRWLIKCWCSYSQDTDGFAGVFQPKSAKLIFNGGEDAQCGGVWNNYTPALSIRKHGLVGGIQIARFHPAFLICVRCFLLSHSIFAGDTFIYCSVSCACTVCDPDDFHVRIFCSGRLLPACGRNHFGPMPTEKWKCKTV